MAQLKGSSLRHPPNVRVFSSRPEKDVRTKEAKLTMILEFYQYIRAFHQQEDRRVKFQANVWSWCDSFTKGLYISIAIEFKNNLELL